METHRLTLPAGQDYCFIGKKDGYHLVSVVPTDYASVGTPIIGIAWSNGTIGYGVFAKNAPATDTTFDVLGTWVKLAI